MAADGRVDVTVFTNEGIKQPNVVIRLKRRVSVIEISD